METTDGKRERLRPAAGGGEASATGPTLFATEPAAATALELLNAETRLPAQATGGTGYRSSSPSGSTRCAGRAPRRRPAARLRRE